MPRSPTPDRIRRIHNPEPHHRIARFLGPGVLVLATFAWGARQADAQSANRFRGAPEFDLSASLAYFVHERHEEDVDDWLYDWRTGVEFATFSLDDSYLIWVQARVGVRTGRQPEGLGVDPNFLDVGFGVVAEWRLDPVSLWGGLEHASFHSIDRDLAASIWWWKWVGGVTSPGVRPAYDPEALPMARPAAATRGFDWGVTMSYWPEELPFLGDETSKGHPWKFDALLAVRFTLFQRSWHGLHLHSRTYGSREKGSGNFRGDDLDGAWHGFQSLALEWGTLGETFGFSVVLAAVLRDSRIQRFNRDGLVSLAIGLTH